MEDGLVRVIRILERLVLYTVDRVLPSVSIKLHSILQLNTDVCSSFPLSVILDAHSRYGGMGTILVIQVTDCINCGATPRKYRGLSPPVLQDWIRTLFHHHLLGKNTVRNQGLLGAN